MTYSVIEEIKGTKIISKFDVHYNLFTKDLFGLSIMLNLMLNVKNIKERRSIVDYSPVLISGEKAEQVTILRVHFDCQLQWLHHVEHVCAQISQCFKKA